MHERSGAVMRRLESARGTWAMASLFQHLLEGEESGGTLSVAMVTQPPGVATPLHRHTREAEAFYLLSGRIEYHAGDDRFDLTAGCFLHLPIGVPHRFRVRGEEPAQFLALSVPGGLFSLYDEVGIPAAEPRLPGADGLTPEVEIPRWAQAAPRYGLQVEGPPIPE